MGLKCSVLGHAYGETTVERDREERGSEVVITIRELETCDRCGDTRVVTENKEVTTIETSDDVADVTAEDAMAAMDPSDDGGADGVGSDAATAGDAEPGDDSLVEDAEGGTAVAPGSASGPSPDTVEDEGAEILDEDADERTDEAVDDELADPTVENDADVPGESGDEDAVIIDDGPGGNAAGTTTDPDEDTTTDADEDIATDADEDTTTDADENAPTGGYEVTHEEFGDAGQAAPFEEPDDEGDEDDSLGEWPEETLRDDADWTPSEDLTGTAGEVDPDREGRRERSSNSAVTVPEGEFHCRKCDYSTSVEASSLRAGDYCPECRSATLVHRADE